MLSWSFCPFYGELLLFCGLLLNVALGQAGSWVLARTEGERLSQRAISMAMLSSGTGWCGCPIPLLKVPFPLPKSRDKVRR